jgi:histidyl-tRNA synthetase
MAKVTVTIPQGTRDFSADVVRKRQYILNTIRTVFETYGFAPLETPAMENLDTLMGKYGDEGDKLIFKVLNNGLDNDSKKASATAAFENVLNGKSDKNLTERALKYDLTIPFARYVAMNNTTLTMPFKRYQIQPVWRADRPQRGRYREFYQCDVDVVGSTSLMNEVELVNIYATVFNKLGINVAIKMNSRKILAALAQKCGGVQNLTNITIAIDKLDKIGIEKIKEELLSKNISENYVAIIEQYLAITDLKTNEEKIAAIKNLLGNTAIEGISDLEFVLDKTPSLNKVVELDFTLARGLNYYTGCIFEIKALEATMGSIGGGGRYDDLTGTFGVPNIPGVGVSFGVDRIYDVMEELNLFPEQINVGTQVLFFNIGEAENNIAFVAMQQLRSKGIACEMIYDATKLDKQFKLAEKKNIPFVVNKIITENEIVKFGLKNIVNGEQHLFDLNELLGFSFLIEI